MTDTVIHFPKRTMATYKARCDNCNRGDGSVRYFPTSEQMDRWARIHALQYHHTTRTPSRVYSVVNSEGVIYGTD